MGKDRKILQVNSTILPKACMCSWYYRTVPSEFYLLGTSCFLTESDSGFKRRSILSWWGSPRWRLSVECIFSRFMRAILGEGRVKGITQNEENKHTTLIYRGEKNKESSLLNIWGTVNVEPVQSRWGSLIGCCSDELYRKVVGSMLSTSALTAYLEYTWYWKCRIITLLVRYLILLHCVALTNAWLDYCHEKKTPRSISICLMKFITQYHQTPV